MQNPFFKIMNQNYNDIISHIIIEWDTSNVKDMSFMFSEKFENEFCIYRNENLKVLPDISKWKTYNLKFLKIVIHWNIYQIFQIGILLK